MAISSSVSGKTTSLQGWAVLYFLMELITKVPIKEGESLREKSAIITVPLFKEILTGLSMRGSKREPLLLKMGSSFKGSGKMDLFNLENFFSGVKFYAISRKKTCLFIKRTNRV